MKYSETWAFIEIKNYLMHGLTSHYCREYPKDHPIWNRG